MTISKQLFRIAGGSSFAVSIFQAVISFVPSWSLHFGAPEELVANTTMLITAGLIAAIIFAIFGLYALAGAGDIQTLPLLRIGLLGICGVYTIRGLSIIPQLLIMWEIIQSTETLSSTMLASSLISLVIGILYFLGIVVGWRNLQPNTKS